MRQTEAHPYTILLRPLADRDIFAVQDYVRVTGGNGGDARDRYVYTYNQDVDHPYFAKRAGFVRTKIKYQGLVGVVGDGGETRLTWLVNMDVGGLIPSAFTAGLLVGLMSSPFVFVEDTRKHLQAQQGEAAAATNSFAIKSKTDDVAGKLELERKLKAELAEAKSELGRKDAELKRKDAGLKRKDAELKRKDEELRQKDEEHLVALAGRDEQLMELRRRLPRVVGEEGEA